MSAFLTEELRFDASYSFVDAEYDRFDGFDVTGDGQPDPDLTVLLDFPNVPSQVAYAGFTYDRVLQAGGIVTSQLWVTYADSQFADDANNLELPSYTLWNATLSYEFAGLPLRISVYGKNLTDEEFSNGGASINLFDTKWALGPRRQFGVEFTLTL